MTTAPISGCESKHRGVGSIPKVEVRWSLADVWVVCITATTELPESQFCVKRELGMDVFNHVPGSRFNLRHLLSLYRDEFFRACLGIYNWI